ncbi:MAG TPA: ATP-dependent RecD-like DNA helicase [Egibacteraceae bacterium]|nr:ATP-dependent RecD-like DNA helicase [Egibacteraceae bacterium]
MSISPELALPAADSERLRGEVRRMVFANPSSGWAVVELTSEEGDDDDGPRAAGPLAALKPGESVELIGRWARHPVHGMTFQATSYVTARPRSTAGLAAFLASDRFHGVGEKTAERLVEAFGLELADIVESDPTRLASVRGVSLKLASRIGQAWADAGELSALMTELADAGVPASLAQAIHRRHGDSSRKVIAQDPYRLLGVRGFTWAHAEALARAQGIALDDPRRTAAGAVEAQRGLSARHGHVTSDSDSLAAATGELLRVRPERALEALDLARMRGLLAHDVPEGADPAAGGWYLPEELAAEHGLASALARLVSARSKLPKALREWAPDRHGDQPLTDEQAAAVRAALTSPVSVLTGGPGTGKTRTVMEVVRACASADVRLVMCAPTGRAAKRLEEVTGQPAATIHSLLDAKAAPGEGFRFGYTALNRLPHEFIVADEWSMADTRLACALVEAVRAGAHLLLVGDADQLPSIGPGAVLRDLLSARGDDGAPLIPATTLATIHRQASASRIVTLAHQINAGDAPIVRGREADVFAVPERSPAIADRVAEIVAVRAPAFFGCAPSDVQVLAPMYRGPAGVDHLNERMKERLNPAQGRPPVSGFHEGDRVVQTRNDAERGIANGDIGEVISADAKQRILQVAFPTGVVECDSDEAADLRPAWCLTVHKSQGGEWPVVVLVIDPSHRVMLWRELLYTAVTRAVSGLLIVGDPAQLPGAARRTGSGARLRKTLLVPRLRAALSAAEAAPGLL